MTVWFTSDPHLGHKLVSGLRGFETTDEHDMAFVHMWNRMVRKNDQVWVLGDLAMSSPTYALDLMKALPGDKHLIFGNHDGGHSMHREAHKNQRHYLEAFDSVQCFARRKIGSRYVMLSHFPYDNDTRHLAEFEGRDQYAPYRLRDAGMWLLHGHTHNAERIHDGRQLHVGLDAWGQELVSLDTIANLISEYEDAQRAKPTKDSQVDEMLADPTQYFAKVRTESRAEARNYVAQQERSARARRGIAT